LLLRNAGERGAGDLPKDVGILRAAAQHNRANVGVYASVLQGGRVRRGDSVEAQ
jgi:MOSC domain-containing protein YiiM